MKFSCVLRVFAPLRAIEINMLVFDELKKNDPQLRLVAMLLAAGLLHFAGGLVVGAGRLGARIPGASGHAGVSHHPAFRPCAGKILDREGRVLAENRPRYNLSLYLDDLRKQFDAAYGAIAETGRATRRSRPSPRRKKNWAAR